MQRGLRTSEHCVEEPEEVFHISQVGVGSRAMVTMEVGHRTSENLVTFQLDTGAECNLLSLKEYQRATGDHSLERIQRCFNKLIKTYTNKRYKILGSAKIPTWRRGQQNILTFNITEDEL